jgi:aspartate aminotransferase-like enzyme
MAQNSLTVMGGQDQVKGKILRMGHMGYITDSDMHETTLRIGKGLIDFGVTLDIEHITTVSKKYLKDTEIK